MGLLVCMSVEEMDRNNPNCSPQTPGMWRCNISDANGKMQSLYGYIGRTTADGIAFKHYFFSLCV